MPSNLTTIPAPRVPLIDATTGLIATEWYRFLFNLYTLSGSGSNVISIDELQLGPPTQPVTTSGGGSMVYPGSGIANSTGSAWATSYTTTGTGSVVALQTSPTLITPILGTPTSGNFSTGTFTWPTFNQNTTGYAASLAGGLAGSLPYQSALNTTTFLAAGTNGQVLTLAAGVPSWATPTTGTVTSVSGTGSVNGITLTGTVTSSGSLTLGGTLSGIGNSQLTNSSITINGSSVSLGGSVTVTATASAALTIGTGLSGTSYNGSTAVTIANTGVLGVTGTAPVVSSGGQNPAISMAAATTSVSGYLTSTDWNTFNNKQPAGTYVTSVTGTAPVVSSGGTAPAISMAAATTSVNGYLTSTDWTTFNSKQAALVSGTNIKTVGGNSLLGSGDVGTIGIAYGGTGQTTAVAGFNALNPMTTTGDIIYEASPTTAARLGIGTTGQVLTVVAGLPAWAAASGGGSNITALGLWENANTINANYTIGTGNNAQSAGPITINTGVTVTVPTGSTWVIV